MAEVPTRRRRRTTEEIEADSAVVVAMPTVSDDADPFEVLEQYANALVKENQKLRKQNENLKGRIVQITGRESFTGRIPAAATTATPESGLDSKRARMVRNLAEKMRKTLAGEPLRAPSGTGRKRGSYRKRGRAES